MTDFNFIHAADLHLDTPFRGIQVADPDTAAALRDASLQALDNLVEAALERSVDFVVFAGDIYDGADRGVRAQLAFQSALQRLDDAGIRAFIIHGNHDPLDGWSAIAQFPDNTFIFPEQYTAVPFEKNGEVVATIHGVSYAQNHVTENLSRAYRKTGIGFEIGILHTEVGKPGSNYAPCSLADLEQSGLDYWALGHIHSQRVLCEEPLVVYSGNTQGRSFSKTGPAGVRYVEVTDGKVSRFDFIEVDSWRFATIEVDAGEAADVAELVDLIEERLASVDNDRPLVARVQLVGASDAFDALARGGVQPIEDQIRDSTGRRRPRISIARIENKTRPRIDIDAVLRRDDFGAEVVRCAQDNAFVPDASESIAAKYRRKLDRYLADEAAQPNQIKTEAINLALEHLLGENR